MSKKKRSSDIGRLVKKKPTNFETIRAHFNLKSEQAVFAKALEIAAKSINGKPQKNKARRKNLGK